MLIEHPWPPFQPRIKAVPSMCATCPFHPNGQGHGAHHDDFQEGGAILTRITQGVTFPCHETVLMHPETRYEGRGVNRHPLPDQDHFRHCLGAVLYKQGKVHAPGTNHQGTPQ